MTFLLGFWIGLFAGIGGYWFVTNPDKRNELIAKIKAMFKKQ